MKPTVDIGVPAYSLQSTLWWEALLASIRQEWADGNIEIKDIFAINSAVPDHNKNKYITYAPFASSEEKNRNRMVDANRVTAVKSFMDGGSDYLFFIDDDTTHKPGTISQLVSLAKPIVAGLYFNPSYPHNPLAYVKEQVGSGLYSAFYGYAKGALTQVDAVGMGCTLIHRSVFQKIMDEHDVFQRMDGSLVPIHKSKIRNRKFLPNDQFKDAYVKDGYYHYPIIEIPKMEFEQDNRRWPFFGLEYGRTEDFYFCELCANVGIRPWVDTTVVCQHWKTLATDEGTYERTALRGQDS